MPAISFSVFLPKIVDGTKTQTIRQERKNPIKKGDQLYFFWKQQSPQCFKIGEAVCSKARSILIYFNGVRIFNGTDSEAAISETIVDKIDLDRFAQQDGFDDWAGMRSFFDRNYKLPFHGVLIEWENLTLSDDLKTRLELIATAQVEDDRLIITDRATLQTTIKFSQHPALVRIPKSERTKFSIAQPEGGYLHWESPDIHIDLDSIRTELDPNLKAERQESTSKVYRDYGKAIARILEQHNLTHIEGISKTRIEAISQGDFPDSAELQLLAKAHNLETNDYLNLLSNAL